MSLRDRGAAPIPPEPWDVVLLLAVLLAFEGKQTLIDGVAAALPVGGRLACTVEVGEPLTEAESAAMPGARTVWPVPLRRFEAVLERAGLAVGWRRDDTATHRRVAARLAAEYATRRREISLRTGQAVADDLVAAHRLWDRWMSTGRIRKVSLVATRR